jgi:putative ABC transport system ATP-binding protein
MQAQARVASEQGVARIRVQGVIKRYQRGGETVPALAGIDLEIEPGAFVAIMGPSGCGKSTLLNVLTGVDRPTAGEIWLGDQRLDRLSEAQLAVLRRQRLGLIFQAFNLLANMTALENVMLPALLIGRGAGAARRRARGLLDDLGLSAHAGKVPGELSGGQQQRVAIARALVNDPIVLYADEPTGNLDAQTGHEVLRLLKGLHRQGLTLVLVTHDAQVASQAQRILTMRDGRIVDEMAGGADSAAGLSRLYADLSGLDADD